MFRLRSAESASLQVILAHVCTTNHTKMYNNWSYYKYTHREQKSESKITDPEVTQNYAMESSYWHWPQWQQIN